MKTAPSPIKPMKQTPESVNERQDQIRLRAYELYEQRGRTDGHDVDDWLQAESDMIPMKTKTVAAYRASAATSPRSRS